MLLLSIFGGFSLPIWAILGHQIDSISNWDHLCQGRSTPYVGFSGKLFKMKPETILLEIHPFSTEAWLWEVYINSILKHLWDYFIIILKLKKVMLSRFDPAGGRPSHLQKVFTHLPKPKKCFTGAFVFAVTFQGRVIITKFQTKKPWWIACLGDVLLLMEEILCSPAEVGSFSHYLQARF